MDVVQFENYAASGYSRIPVVKKLPFLSETQFLACFEKAVSFYHYPIRDKAPISLFCLKPLLILSCEANEIKVQGPPAYRKHFFTDQAPSIKAFAWLDDFFAAYRTPANYLAQVGLSYTAACMGHMHFLRGASVPSSFLLYLMEDVLFFNHQDQTACLLTYVDPIERNQCYTRAEQHLNSLADAILRPKENFLSENPHTLVLQDLQRRLALPQAQSYYLNLQTKSVELSSGQLELLKQKNACWIKKSFLEETISGEKRFIPQDALKYLSNTDLFASLSVDEYDYYGSMLANYTYLNLLEALLGLHSNATAVTQKTQSISWYGCLTWDHDGIGHFEIPRV